MVTTISSCDVLGTYESRLRFYQMAVALNVLSGIFGDKSHRKLLHDYFNRFESEPNWEGFLDFEANEARFPIDYGERRRIVNGRMHAIFNRIDERVNRWQADKFSSNTLAFLPLDWDKIVTLKRGEEIPDVITLEMIADREIRSLPGFGPASVIVIRDYCGKVQKFEKISRPRFKRPHRSKKPVDQSLQAALY